MRFIWISFIVFGFGCTLAAEDVKSWLKEARQNLQLGETAKARAAAEKVIQAEPKNAFGYALRAESYSLEHKHKEAIADFNKAIDIDPKLAFLYDRRGNEKFKLGQIKESIDDYDTFLKLQPKSLEEHWRRGISYYYADRFEDGAKQFQLAEEISKNDVENAFWHYLCLARKDGAEKARKSLLKIGLDTRIPFMKIYDLIQGKCKAEDVLATAEKSKLQGEDKTEALFYAHLYVALNYEIEKQPEKCLEHLKIAVDQYKISHYMWDVARVHRMLREKK